MGGIQVKEVKANYESINALYPVSCMTFFNENFSIDKPHLDDIKQS